MPAKEVKCIRCKANLDLISQLDISQDTVAIVINNDPESVCESDLKIIVENICTIQDPRLKGMAVLIGPTLNEAIIQAGEDQMNQLGWFRR